MSSILGLCACERFYYGDLCQYKEECETDRDCGNGRLVEFIVLIKKVKKKTEKLRRCLDLETTTAPRRRCFCELGYFGAGCSRRSPLGARMSESQLEQTHEKRELSDRLSLYWKTVEEDEVEMVIKYTGTKLAADF